MMGKVKKQKLINDMINQENIKTIIDIKSFSIHTKRPVAHKVLDAIAEKTNTQWIGFYNRPDYLFTVKERL